MKINFHLLAIMTISLALVKSQSLDQFLVKKIKKIKNLKDN